MNLRIYNREYTRYPANLSDFKIGRDSEISQIFLAALRDFSEFRAPRIIQKRILSSARQ